MSAALSEREERWRTWLVRHAVAGYTIVGFEHVCGRFTPTRWRPGDELPSCEGCGFEVNTPGAFAFPLYQPSDPT